MKHLLLATLITVALQTSAKAAVEESESSFRLSNEPSTSRTSESVISIQVRCKAPNPGRYSLGWGTSRLIVPEKGKPYIIFRGRTALVDDHVCLSGDNIGLVVIKKDGSVWAYIREDN